MTTSRVRIYVLARSLGVPSTALLEFVKTYYPDVANSVSTLSETQAADVTRRWTHSSNAALAPSPTEPLKPPNSAPTSEHVALVLDSSGQVDVPASLTAAGLPDMAAQSEKRVGEPKKHGKKTKKAKKEAAKAKKAKRKAKKAEQKSKKEAKKAKRHAKKLGKKARRKNKKGSNLAEVNETKLAIRKNGSRKKSKKKT